VLSDLLRFTESDLRISLNSSRHQYNSAYMLYIVDINVELHVSMMLSVVNWSSRLKTFPVSNLIKFISPYLLLIFIVCFVVAALKCCMEILFVFFKLYYIQCFIKYLFDIIQPTFFRTYRRRIHWHTNVNLWHVWIILMFSVSQFRNTNCDDYPNISFTGCYIPDSWLKWT
jgi:hypothetical protein